MSDPAENRDVRGNTIKPHSVEAENVNAKNATVESEPSEANEIARKVDIDAKADLDSTTGVLKSSQVPDLAITSVSTVPDQSSRLSLSVEEGDVAIQTDTDTTFIFTGGDPSVNSNWSEIVLDVLDAISGSTISPDTVNANSVNTESIGTDRYYAAGFDGADADTRLDNALSTANPGDTIYLEGGQYAADRTISSGIIMAGTGGEGGGTVIDGTWTLTGTGGIVRNCQINASNGGRVDADGVRSSIIDCVGVSSPNIQVGADRCRITGGDALNIIFETGTSGGLVNSVTNATITDNGANTDGTTT
jgi:hypothetical protein